MKNFKSIKWLKNNIDNEDLVVLDLRSKSGNEIQNKEEYLKGHIANAIFVPVEEVLSGEVQMHGGRNPLPNIEGFVQKMKEYGIDKEKKVVIYDEGDLSIASRLWWMLKYIGLDQVYVLLGGYRAWESSNYTISTDLPKIKKAKDLSIKIRGNMIANIDDVKKTILNDNEVLVDSRSSERYCGLVEPIDRIPGHIPSAINLPWTDLEKFYLTDINKADIKEHFQALADYEKTILYCGSGVTASVNFIFMDEVGFSPRLYVGSYSDWISYPDNDIAKKI